MANEERSSASKEFDKAAAPSTKLSMTCRPCAMTSGGLAQQVAGLLSAAGSEALRDVKAHMNRAKQGLDAGDSGLEAVDAVRDTAASPVGALEDVVTSVRLRRSPSPSASVSCSGRRGGASEAAVFPVVRGTGSTRP
jgi:hypothetical protein